MTQPTPASEPIADEPRQSAQATESVQAPKQEVGDTPVAPWSMPTPVEQAAVKPVRQALHDALAAVDSLAKADAVIEELATEATEQTKTPEQKKTPRQTKDDVAETLHAASSTAPTPDVDPTLTAAAAQVTQAEQTATPSEKTQRVLAETAHVIEQTEGHQREVLAEATQEVLNPEQQGTPNAAQAAQRTYLRQALLKRLTPFDALDANLFLLINHLPHTRLLNQIFYLMTLIFTGGMAWYALMGITTWRRPRFGWHIIRISALPLAIATALVEYPIKRYFRRKRPFITIIQAIVIGKKPGSWSFPSGHSATAFAGAWLLSQHFPRKRGWLYTIASLVAFSRVYLGDHYPGDVASGATLGTLFAMACRWLNPLKR